MDWWWWEQFKICFKRFIFTETTKRQKDNREIIHDSKSIISDAKSFDEQLYTSKEADIPDEAVDENLDHPTRTNKERDI